MLYSKMFGAVMMCIWRFCFVFVLLMRKSKSTQSQCKLCNRTYQTCSMQFPQYNLTEADCRMEVFELDSSACNSIEMETNSHGEVSGTMLLQAYFYEEERNRQTGFNVSFQDFSWKSITMRFMQNGTGKKNSCRRFHFSDKFLSLKPTSLFYDCLWSNYDYETDTYNFEYSAKSDVSVTYKKHVFTVPHSNTINPTNTNLKKRQLFVKVDITDSPYVVLRAQTLPDICNVSTYNVKVYSGQDQDSTVKGEKNVMVKTGEKEFTFEWNLGIFPGNYFFEVQPVSKSCGESGCKVSRSPYIEIEPSKNLFYAGGASAIIILCMLIVICFKCIRRDKILSTRPKLLLICHSNHMSHIKVISELVQYLRNQCNIEAMYDEFDISKSETQDPAHWYNEAIDKADFIAIVSSPTCCNSTSGIYIKVYEMALRILQNKGFSRKPFSDICNVMVFLLPYCSKKDLPQMAMNIGLYFNIPKDIEEIIKYVQNCKRKRFIGRLYYYLRSNFIWYILRKRVCMKKYPGLQAAIQEASTDVKRCREIEKPEVSIPLEIDKKICRGSYEGLDESIEDCSERSVSETSINTLHNESFPGNIENLNLLGKESEVVAKEDSEPYYKGDSVLEELNL